MKIWSVNQLKEADLYTIARKKITSLKLMERSAEHLFVKLKEDYKLDILGSKVVIICGKGNNGGDGLALARILEDWEVKVKVYLIDSPDYSEDNRAQQVKFPAFTSFTLGEKLKFEKQDILIDCLFGNGLSGPLSEDWRNIITQMNQFHGVKIAVDIPSGLSADRYTPLSSPIFEAHKTFTFQCKKLSFMQPDYARMVGEVEVVDIKLKFPKDQQSTNYLLDDLYVGKLLKKRSKFSHKGNFGRALLVGGSKGMIGAMVLASRACLRSGVGILKAYVPSCGYEILQTTVPECMVETDNDPEILTKLPLTDEYNSVGIGVGMGSEGRTVEACIEFLKNMPKDKNLVIDADGLNILSQNRELVDDLPKNTLLTPHPKELMRLIGNWENDFDKLAKAQAFCNKYQVYLIIKGAYSVFVSPEGTFYYNSTGNAGMATAGSGDVLTGILTSLLAQEYCIKEAALIGMYVHGRAGDIALKQQSLESLVSGDIIGFLGKGFDSLR